MRCRRFKLNYGSIDIFLKDLTLTKFRQVELSFSSKFNDFVKYDNHTDALLAFLKSNN